MRVVLIGAGLGLVVGGLFGAAVFGGLGGAVGMLIGAVAGGGILLLFMAAAIMQRASEPQRVDCPVTGEEVIVRINANRAPAALFTRRGQQVVACSRWSGSPQCGRPCEPKLADRLRREFDVRAA